MRFRSSFRLLAAVLLAVLLPFVVLGGTARAQSIDNVAEARWTFDGTDFQTKSNLYSIKVETNDASIALFRPSLNSGTRIDFSASLCLATNATETSVARADTTSTNDKSADVTYDSSFGIFVDADATCNGGQNGLTQTPPTAAFADPNVTADLSDIGSAESRSVYFRVTIN